MWLYNYTGDAFLIDLMQKIHRNTADWTQPSTLPNWHNVNIAECFREPATYYMLTKTAICYRHHTMSNGLPDVHSDKYPEACSEQARMHKWAA